MSPSPPRSRPRLAPPPARLSGRTPGLSALSAVVLTLVVALATPACGSSRPDQASVPVDTTPAAASTGATSPDAATSDHEAIKVAARDAYVEFWNVWIEANNPPNPSYSRLSDFYTGPQLEGARIGIENNRVKGLIVVDDRERPEDHSLDFKQVELAKVVFDDCSVDNGKTVNASTSEIIDGDTVTYLRRVSMRLEDGKWKVESAEKVKMWPGTSDC